MSFLGKRTVPSSRPPRCRNLKSTYRIWIGDIPLTGPLVTTTITTADRWRGRGSGRRVGHCCSPARIAPEIPVDEKVMREHHLNVTRTARYVTLGNPAGAVDEVWFVCHGYADLAPSFAQYFTVLDNGCRYVVAPEALSRFYLERPAIMHGPGAKIGASWMTREDRMNEISDYVAYLDSLYKHVIQTVGGGLVRVRLLGFSQGAATVCRWIELGAVEAHHLILWGGFVPPELGLDGNTRLGKLKLSIVAGDADAMADKERMAQEEARLESSGLDYQIIRFEGGHHLDKKVLSELASLSV